MCCGHGLLCTAACLRLFSQFQDYCGGFEFVQFASSIPKTLTAALVGIPLFPHFLSSAPLVTYCIMPSVEGYGVWVCHSYSYSGLGLGCPCLSSSFAAPVLYWSGNLIKHVSLKMQYPAHQHTGWSTLFWQHLPCHWSGLQLAPWFSISMSTLCCQPMQNHSFPPNT